MLSAVGAVCYAALCYVCPAAHALLQLSSCLQLCYVCAALWLCACTISLRLASPLLSSRCLHLPSNRELVVTTQEERKGLGTRLRYYSVGLAQARPNYVKSTEHVQKEQEMMTSMRK